LVLPMLRIWVPVVPMAAYKKHLEGAIAARPAETVAVDVSIVSAPVLLLTK
jgi:hypothetical protein